MLILFDHGAPKSLARALPGHTVITAYARGWERIAAVVNAATPGSYIEIDIPFS